MSHLNIQNNGSPNLRELIHEYFTLSEFNILCSDLNIRFDDIKGERYSDHIINLVELCRRTGRTDDLQQLMVKLTPVIASRLNLNVGTDLEPPYKGLKVFKAEDDELFFGRTALINELLTLLHHHSFLMVVGASGSGKSSVIQAGVIPALKNKGKRVDAPVPEGSHEWPIYTITPGSDPLQELAKPFSSSSDVLELRAKLAANTKQLYLTVHFALKKAGASRCLIFVDQFEEVFTQCKDAKTRRLFIDNLFNASDGQAIVVIAMRKTYFEDCDAYERLRKVLSSNQHKYMGALNKAELEEIIKKPAALKGVRLQAGLADAMLKDLGVRQHDEAQQGVLPLLSHALLETWKFSGRGEMTLAAYHAAGGLQGAIAKTADDTFKYKLGTEAKQKVAEQIFLSLTEIGSGVAEDTRRRATEADLLSLNQAEALEVLHVLQDARLITADSDPQTQAKVFQVTHEALIREWSQLQNWIAENREALNYQNKIKRSIKEWKENSYNDSFLYSKLRLEHALDWLQKNGPIATRQEREFIEKSQEVQKAKESEAAARREEQRQKQAQEQLAKIRRRFSIATLVPILLFIGYWVIPFISGQINRARVINNYPMIEVGNFAIGQFEVSNHQFSLCVDSGKCGYALPEAILLNEETLNLPVTNITVFQANQFCQWLSFELPTKEEWLLATTQPNITSSQSSKQPQALPYHNLEMGKIYYLKGSVWELTRSMKTNEVWDGRNETFIPNAVFFSMGGSYLDEARNLERGQPLFGTDQKRDIGFRCLKIT